MNAERNSAVKTSIVFYLALAADVCWFSLVFFPIMRKHAISCESMPFHAKSRPFRQNHANSGHGLAWIFPPALVEFPPKKRVQLMLFCVAPIPLISMLLLRCATVEFLKLFLQPPQGGHAMKQQAEIRCDHSVREHKQTSLWDSVKLRQYQGLVSTVAMC